LIGSVRRVKRAQVLLAADQGSADQVISKNVAVGTSTVYRTKQRFVEKGLECALSELPREGAPRKLEVEDEAMLHSAGALYERFPPSEARRILDRLEFHYTPKHASWLNMVEIEIGVMVAQCLDRRIPDKAILVSEVAEWQRRRKPNEPASTGCSPSTGHA
jgi:transposase